MSGELVSKAFMDDNYLAHFGNYLHKIGKHIVLDISEAKDWVTKKVSSNPEEEEDSAAASTAAADEANESNTGTAVMALRKKKILILMSDTVSDKASPHKAVLLQWRGSWSSFSTVMFEQCGVSDSN